MIASPCTDYRNRQFPQNLYFWLLLWQNPVAFSQFKFFPFSQKTSWLFSLLLKLLFPLASRMFNYFLFSCHTCSLLDYYLLCSFSFCLPYVLKQVCIVVVVSLAFSNVALIPSPLPPAQSTFPLFYHSQKAHHGISPRRLSDCPGPQNCDLHMLSFFTLSHILSLINSVNPFLKGFLSSLGFFLPLCLRI